MNNRIALTGDYFSLSQTIDDTDVDYNNFEIGTNIYFGKKGRGLYAGISYFSFDANGTFNDVEFNDGSFGSGSGNIEFNTINTKLGLKVGRVLYFRLEVGYSFGDIPEFITVTGPNNTTAVEEIPEIPGITTSGLPVFNIGFGFAFF